MQTHCLEVVFFFFCVYYDQRIYHGMDFMGSIWYFCFFYFLIHVRSTSMFLFSITKRIGLWFFLLYIYWFCVVWVYVVAWLFVPKYWYHLYFPFCYKGSSLMFIELFSLFFRLWYANFIITTSYLKYCWEIFRHKVMVFHIFYHWSDTIIFIGCFNLLLPFKRSLFLLAVCVTAR